MPIEQRGVTSGTKQNLVEGVRSSPMSVEAVDAVMDQVLIFAEQIVDIYSMDVAAGEVGANGSGAASEDPIIGARPPRALLYGRIQSGKTVSMILTSALALDNGFRVVVVLTTDNVALVKQTASRFKDLDGPRVFAAVKEGSSYEWQGQEEVLRQTLSTEGLVLVCAKNHINLPEVIRFLQQLDASNYPVLVLDDEADAATLDTTLAARSAGKPNAPQFKSTMNRLVVANDRPDEAGFSLGEELPHSVYVQVTATPYILFLQRENADLRPTTTFLLEPGRGYTGGEVFFGQYDPEATGDELPRNLVFVAANEAILMRRSAPPGLAKSINFFVLSACALSTEKGWPTQGFKHLSHTSHKTDEHETVSNYIEAHLNVVRGCLRGSLDEARAFFSEAYNELTRTVQTCPPLDTLISTARLAVRHAEVFRINSKADVPVYGPRLNFLIGGNILGRGLTIDDLLTTYYIREAKTSQMDTVWQHARMYGYRHPYLDYVRVYLPHRLAARFREIHEAEEALRLTVQNGNNNTVLIRVPFASRPTRPNALETGAIRTVQGGRDQINPQSYVEDSDAAAIVLNLLTSNGVPTTEGDRERRPTVVPMDVINALVENVVIADDDPGPWELETIQALLQSFSDLMQGGGTVYVRDLLDTQAGRERGRGRLGGQEIAIIRRASPDAPSLALLYVGDPAMPTAWFPTIVMPKGSPTYVFAAE
ncbi:Z1 domain-containing protein [Rhizobium leguminosarum]|uniref:Z1 domain-containing protein n=1 Tax=Rhizobium leguminosarum TaxID=384 RepID=UPI001C96E0AC|nr:Z1 domain-containing protein [Rhizobium leguminosarum]MBY5524061.1 hypothetical protein [Rhizobium leguminosarum]